MSDANAPRAGCKQPPSPYELWEQVGGDRDEYRRLMIKHGHLVPRDRCSKCGISKQQVLGKHEEIRLKLEAMTAARDLCKQQTQDVSDRYLALRAWLRDNYPEVYEAVVARD
jgi:hypothetical protein